MVDIPALLLEVLKHSTINWPLNPSLQRKETLLRRENGRALAIMFQLPENHLNWGSGWRQWLQGEKL
jgi:hypothetical protein